MLTGDLVRVRVQKGELKCGFVEPDNERLLERAAELIAAFSEHVGQRRCELDDAIALIEGDGVDHKLTRGLAKIISDRSNFDVSAPVPPADIRNAVFRHAARVGPLAVVAVEGARPTRDQVWDAVAAELGADVSALRGALYADHEDQQVLLDVEVPDRAWLLHRYNVALVQSALLKCALLEVRLRAPTAPRLRQLLRAVKFHQLIFTCVRDGEDYVLQVDGPASLFAQSSRYGVALGRFFPAILLQPGAWTLEATVLWGNVRRPLKLDSTHGLRSHYRDLGAYETREAAWFKERFLALDCGWTLEPEPVPVDLGGEAVVVPDFTFRKGKKVAHLEILGFWRKGTIPRRLELLKRHGPKNLLIAVSSRLAGDRGEELPEQVISFAEVIPAKKVLAWLEGLGP